MKTIYEDLYYLKERIFEPKLKEKFEDLEKQLHMLRTKTGLNMCSLISLIKERRRQKSLYLLIQILFKDTTEEISKSMHKERR